MYKLRLKLKGTFHVFCLMVTILSGSVIEAFAKIHCTHTGTIPEAPSGRLAANNAILPCFLRPRMKKREDERAEEPAQINDRLNI